MSYHLALEDSSAYYLLDNLNLAIETSGSAFYQRHVSRKAHFVDMPPCIQIVKRIEDDVETLKEFEIEVGVLDVCVMRFKLDVRIERRGALFCHLRMESELEVCAQRVDRACSPLLWIS